MYKSIEECKKSVLKNIEEIHVRIIFLSPEELTMLFEKIDHVMNFYEFTREEIEQILNLNALDLEKYSDEELLKIEGITAAIIFQLKFYF